MGNVLAMFAWAIPFTIFSIYKSERSRKNPDGTDYNTHRFNPEFAHLYPPPSAHKLKRTMSDKKAHPLNSYKLCTKHGRTNYFPIDPFFKELKGQSMRTPCPKFNMETVFEESKQLFETSDNLHEKYESDSDSAGTRLEDATPIPSPNFGDRNDRAEESFIRKRTATLRNPTEMLK